MNNTTDPAMTAALRAFYHKGRREWVPLFAHEISRRAKCDVSQGLRSRLVAAGLIAPGRTPDQSVDYHITREGKAASGIMEGVRA